MLCSGEGLRHGVVGREIRSWIDTRRAGPGELTAHCTGPKKVAYCELYDHGDATFTLNVKPQEPGRHLLTIKYGNQHVNGSPFQLKVAGAPDASKVRNSFHVFFFSSSKQTKKQNSHQIVSLNFHEYVTSCIYRLEYMVLESSMVF